MLKISLNDGHLYPQTEKVADYKQNWNFNQQDKQNYCSIPNF
jgi:hypothetical protein